MLIRIGGGESVDSEIGDMDAWSGGSTGNRIARNVIKLHTDGSRTTKKAESAVFSPKTKYYVS